MRRLSFLFLLAVFAVISAGAQDLASFEKRVTVKTLANGLTLVVLERPEAPVFSFYTHVDAGAVQDPKGQGGLAHMFEHMAFKGTDKIGTTNYAAEKIALQKVEQTYAAYDFERRRGTGSDAKKLEELKQAWEKAREAAQKFIGDKENEFSRIIDENGGENLNASTDLDETTYYYSFPSNRLELWAYLESERFLHPVFREFYKERDVVYEERRMRVDSNPIGRLIEQFVAAAFIAHPYHNEGIGFPSELVSFSATDAENFFKKYYVPSNMVVAVVGDVKAAQVVPIVEKYFGRLPARPKPEEISLVEPQQIGERRVVVRGEAQPFYLEGYHRPDYRDPDDNVYDVISDLLSTGRTSRLYRALVRDKKIAIDAAGFSGFPGNKYPNLFAFYAVPARGHSNQEIEAAIHEEIEKLKNQDITDAELKMVKTRMKADLIRGLADNEGLASQLAIYQTRYGDWRELFRQIDRIEKVTKADVRRVANKIFVPTNRTLGVTETNAPAKTTATAQPQGGSND